MSWAHPEAYGSAWDRGVRCTTVDCACHGGAGGGRLPPPQGAATCGGIGHEECEALARALASGNMCSLEYLISSMGRARGDRLLAELIKGLRQCPSFKSFNLSDHGMGQESGLALLQGLRDGCWANLEEVDVSGNPDLGMMW